MRDGAPTKGIEEQSQSDGCEEENSVGTQKRGESRCEAGKNQRGEVAASCGLSGEGAAGCIEPERDGEDGEALRHRDACVGGGKRAEHGQRESNFGRKIGEMAAGKGGEEKTGGEIGDGLEEINGNEPGVGPKAREKKFERAEKNRIGGQAIGGG